MGGAESHPPFVVRQQMTVRERHTMRVAGQIVEDLRRATPRGLGIDAPLEVLQGSQTLLPRVGGRQRLTVARERQAALRMALAEPDQKEAPAGERSEGTAPGGARGLWKRPCEFPSMLPPLSSPLVYVFFLHSGRCVTWP